MTLVETLHAERKARLARMGASNPTDKLEALLKLHHGKSESDTQPAGAIKALTLDIDKVIQADVARPLVGDIRKLVCQYFGINNELMVSETKHLSVARPRQIGMYLCWRYSGRGFKYIAERFGRSDHTTPRAAVMRIQALCKSDWLIAYDVAHLEVALAGRFQCEL